jgi:hypothetical protein
VWFRVVYYQTKRAELNPDDELAGVASTCAAAASLSADMSAVSVQLVADGSFPAAAASTTAPMGAGETYLNSTSQ